MKKKQISKKSSKIDRWQGTMDERTATLIKTTEELKEAVKDLHYNVDTKFSDLETKIDSKFEKHNMHHEYVEKKYRTYFLIVAAISVGGALSNPDSLKFFVNMITTILRFVGVS